MKRVRSLGSVVFDKNAMFVQQDYEPNTFMAATIKSAAGTNIEFYATDNTPELTLDSQGYSVIDEAGVDGIINMYNNPSEYQLQYVDGSTQSVRFRLDKPPKFTEYALGACLYTATIYLTKLN